MKVALSDIVGRMRFFAKFHDFLQGKENFWVELALQHER